MEDIDDLSDTEKVSLISDLELNDEAADIKGAELLDEVNKEIAIDENVKDNNLGELNLNLLKIHKLNFEKDQGNSGRNQKIKRINNGILISKSKQKCSHKRTCSSCYELPPDVLAINIASQEQLMEHLSMTDEERLQRKKELDFYKN